MIEYSSPNTNKPLHLGHIRNNLLGYSVAQILKANGHRVIKANLVNDRGIHICKSMLAWKLYGNGETPASSGMKGDHLVGKYYVEFDKHYKAQIQELIAAGQSEEEAKKKCPHHAGGTGDAAPLGGQGSRGLLALGDHERLGLRRFRRHLQGAGRRFRQGLLRIANLPAGQEPRGGGVAEGVFFRKEDNSVWIDLEADGLDQKLLLRGDGTSVYMTQDLGTAYRRFEDNKLDDMIYVVGNEQNYHFQVLKLVLKKLGYADWSDHITHLSYGMVELPEGKMKSREGTVVDADDLIEKMVSTAREMSDELGKLDGCSEQEANAVATMVGLGALKYFILKVDPKKTMLFDPRESIDFNGNTGPFIQYTHARIRSILRKAAESGIDCRAAAHAECLPEEIGLIKALNDYPAIVASAGENFAPPSSAPMPTIWPSSSTATTTTTPSSRRRTPRSAACVCNWPSRWPAPSGTPCSCWASKFPSGCSRRDKHKKRRAEVLLPAFSCPDGYSCSAVSSSGSLNSDIVPREELLHVRHMHAVAVVVGQHLGHVGLDLLGSLLVADRLLPPV